MTSRRFEVRDASMEPVLAPGDRILVDRRAYRSEAPLRGDLLVFRDPEDDDRLLLKRLAGLPGDLVRRDDNGYALGTPFGELAPGTLVRSLHPHELFVTGDNAAVSRDSRRFGPIDRRLVVGRAWFRYAPPKHRGPL